MSTPTQVLAEDVEWFSGYGPVPVGSECDHDCEHRSQAVIAWGPTFTLYELTECSDCKCRAWRAALPRSNGGIRESHPWMAVLVPQPEDARRKNAVES